MKCFSLLYLILIASQGLGQVVISEIMFNPPGTERYNEFIELYNSSPRDSIDLNNWLVSDGTKYNTIQPYQNSAVLKPLQFAVLLSPNYFLKSGYFDTLIADNAQLLVIEPTAFGSYGLSNSRNEEISLFRPDTTLVDRWQYSTPNPNGHSEEKKILTRPNTPKNWGNSAVLNGTPGFKNSITPPDYHIEIAPPNITPGVPGRKDSLAFSIFLYNSGVSTVNSVTLSIGKDVNRDSILTPSESITSITYRNKLIWGDSITAELILPPQSLGSHLYTIEIKVCFDSLSKSFGITSPVYIDYAEHDLIISELLYNGADHQDNFIELYNTTSKTINLGGFSLFFDQDETPVVFSDSVVLNPLTYIVLVDNNQEWTQPIPSIKMNNLFKTISGRMEIVSEQNKVIDSIRFNIEPDYRSLERTAKGDFRTCRHPLQKTAGGCNSWSEDINDLFLQAIDVETDSLIFLQNQEFIFEFMVDRFGNFQDTNYTLSLFQTEPAGLLWQSTATRTPQIHSYRFTDLAPGLHRYTLLLENNKDTNVFNNRLDINLFKTCPYNAIVINEILYNTENKDQEWIELFNRSAFPINLKNWQLSDSRKRVLLTDSTVILPSFQYLLLANKPIAAETAAIINDRLPEFNNRGDEVILYDPGYTLVDSMEYSELGRAQKQISLERIRYEKSSLNPENWAFSTDSSGSTPGYLNSNSPKAHDISLCRDDFSNIKATYQNGESATIKVPVINSGRQPIDQAVIRLFCAELHDSLNASLIDEKAITDLEPQEKRSIAFLWQNLAAGVHYLLAEVWYEKDLNPFNDLGKKLVTVGYDKSCLVINEIMASPAVGQPEWFELYNPATTPVELFNWTFSDSDSNRYPLVHSSSLLKGQCFAIVAEALPEITKQSNACYIEPENFPTLNTEDRVSLFDGTGTLIDEIDYATLTVETRGKSIERINPNIAANRSDNWAICVDAKGHTAGLPNSLFTHLPCTRAKINIAPNPFSPDGDGCDDRTAIRFSLPLKIAKINVKIFDCKGRMVRFLCNNKPTGRETTVFWDGLDDFTRPCRSGIYIIAVEALDRNNTKKEKLIKTVVLAFHL